MLYNFNAIKEMGFSFFMHCNIFLVLLQLPNRYSLRKLSIVLRQKSAGLSPEDRLRNIETGLTKVLLLG